MNDGDDQRRLSAILAADVVGYTRRMEQDTDGTVAAWKIARSQVIDPTIAGHAGRIVKHTGDGFLAEFSTVLDATNCAITLQEKLSDGLLDFRMGIHLGDIVDDGQDIHGEGVNIAARIEGLAEPGEICVSGTVFEAVHNRLEVAFQDMGEQAVKHVSAPVRVYRIKAGGVVPVQAQSAGVNDDVDVEQEIHFCHTLDGVSLAYAITGQGAPLVKAPNWMNHLEYDWKSPVWGPLLRALSSEHKLLRFDQRCNGLSDWDVEDLTFDSMVDDMASVIDASGFERFPLLGISQGCAYSIAYAARHPERVSRLVLYGGFAQGLNKRGGDEDKQAAALQEHLILSGWGQDNPAFRQFFTSMFMPGASKAQMDWLNELQKTTISPENAVRVRRVVNEIDIGDLCASISVPTLVVHCRGDGISPFDQGRKMAAMIPNARFVALEGNNHLILEDEPAWPRFLKEVTEFLAAD